MSCKCVNHITHDIFCACNLPGTINREKRLMPDVYNSLLYKDAMLTTLIL